MKSLAVIVFGLAVSVACQDHSDVIGEDEKHSPVSWEAVDLVLNSPHTTSDQPPEGFVSDEHTAIRIAEAVASALYGEQQTRKELPFKARLKDGVWTVIGTMRPEGIYGGTALIQIRKSDGCIIFAVHEQ